MNYLANRQSSSSARSNCLDLPYFMYANSKLFDETAGICAGLLQQ